MNKAHENNGINEGRLAKGEIWRKRENVKAAAWYGESEINGGMAKMAS
jgi:hypothetical protein